MAQKHSPLVTAVIPIYNHEKYVVESVNSIVGQTYENMELILINDGSTDQSHEKVLTLIEKCKQRFVRFEYINRPNKGLSATLNEALSMAQGEYFTILASDDVALPRKTEALLNALLEKDDTYAVAFGDALFIDDESRKITIVTKNIFVPISNEYEQVRFLDFYKKSCDLDSDSEPFGSYRSFLIENYVPAMSNLIRTQRIRDVGGWTDKNILEDWEIWLKLSRDNKFALIDEPVALYRWHALNATKTNSKVLDFASYLLVAEQEEFCAARGLSSEWTDARRVWIRRLIHDSTLPRARRLEMLRAVDFFYWLNIAFKRITRKRPQPERKTEKTSASGHAA